MAHRPRIRGVLQVPVLDEAQCAQVEDHLKRHPPPDKASVASHVHLGANLATLVARGRVPAAIDVDLHGLTLERAWLRLDAAISRHPGTYLRVITGKGLHSRDGGVLADEIPARLRVDWRIAELERGVRARDGGSGVWFVRVKDR